MNNSAEQKNWVAHNPLFFLILDEEARIARLRTPNAITVTIAERFSSRDDALWFDNESSRCQPAIEVWTISISPDQSQRVFHSTRNSPGPEQPRHIAPPTQAHQNCED